MPTSPTETVVTLLLHASPTTKAWPGNVRCPVCESPMEVQQPDPDQPDRLLGICEGCKRWALLIHDKKAKIVIAMVMPDDVSTTQPAELPQKPLPALFRPKRTPRKPR